MIVVSPEGVRRSERLVIAFTGIRQKLGGLKHDFHRSLERLDCAALYVRDPECRWWQYDEPLVSGVIERIRTMRERAGASRLVCIGNSMGGFAALYFGARLDADAILAFSAQAAIDPSVTERLGDRRWAEYQAAIPAYPFGDLALQAPARGRTALCWGERDALDLAHADWLARTWTFERLVVPGARHDAAAQLRDADRLRPLLEEAIAS